MSCITHECCPPSIQACKTRTILTLEQALQIFEIKLDNSNPLSGRRTAAAVARSFGVSEKTVRDIWIGRTWVREMMHLDPARAAKACNLKLPGRPKRSTTAIDHECTSANRHSICFLYECAVESTPSNSIYTAFSTICEEQSDTSTEPTSQGMIWEYSSNSNDPFHDDWPHWAAAHRWEMYAATEGYIVSPTSTAPA